MAFDGIDLLKLFVGDCPGFEDDYKHLALEDSAKFDAARTKKLLTSHDKWNNWLKDCERKQNMNELIRTRKGLQIGMDNLVKKRLTTDMLNEMFLRWTMSIERTARKIINKKFPLPDKADDAYLKSIVVKRQRDQEFEKFLRKASF